MFCQIWVKWFSRKRINLSLPRLRLIHKFRVHCFQRSCPLNPPILGDFEFRSPPKLGGIKGGQCSILRSFQDVYKRQPWQGEVPQAVRFCPPKRSLEFFSSIAFTDLCRMDSFSRGWRQRGILRLVTISPNPFMKEHCASGINRGGLRGLAKSIDVTDHMPGFSDIPENPLQRIPRGALKGITRSQLRSQASSFEG
jgi:hypothetical protein